MKKLNIVWVILAIALVVFVINTQQKKTTPIAEILPYVSLDAQHTSSEPQSLDLYIPYFKSILGCSNINYQTGTFYINEIPENTCVVSDYYEPIYGDATNICGPGYVIDGREIRTANTLDFNTTCILNSNSESSLCSNLITNSSADANCILQGNSCYCSWRWQGGDTFSHSYLTLDQVRNNKCSCDDGCTCLMVNSPQRPITGYNHQKAFMYASESKFFVAVEREGSDCIEIYPESNIGTVTKDGRLIFKDGNFYGWCNKYGNIAIGGTENMLNAYWSTFIHQSSCTPNWQTGDWEGTCSAACIQSRDVRDLNTCGVTTGMPSTTRTCTGGSCTHNCANGTIWNSTLNKCVIIQNIEPPVDGSSPWLMYILIGGIVVFIGYIYIKSKKPSMV